MVTPLIDGAEYFQAVRNEIHRARRGDAIYLLGWRFDSNFRFNPDPKDPTRLSDVLAANASIGVDVRLIMSAKWQLYWYLQDNTPDEIRAKGIGELNDILRWFGPEGNLCHGNRLRKQAYGGKTPLAERVRFDYRGELAGIHHQKAVIVVRRGVPVAFVAGIDFLPDRLDGERHQQALPRPNATYPGARPCGADEAGPIGYYWHDAGVRVDGPAAADVLWFFALRWSASLGQPDRGFTLRDYPGLPPALKTIPSLNPDSTKLPPLQVVRSAPAAQRPLNGVFVAANFPENDAQGSDPVCATPDSTYGQLHSTGALYRRAISAAQRYIYIEDQYLSAPSLFPFLADRAKNNVKVIGVTGNYDDDHQALVAPMIGRSDSPLVRFIISLGPAAANVKVFHLGTSAADATIVHSKLMIVDDEFFVIGSANFHDRSLINAPYSGPYAALGGEIGVRETDSELSVAATDNRGGADNVARALRIRLWAGHLRVDQWNSTVRQDLSDLNRSLSIFNRAWGRPVRFPIPRSRLVEARLP